ncbi:MAG: polysaccharide biosynthesis protein [Erysipelotrichaceae bacterium]|jgi:UDP-glucose 4-epimerase|nr:polysaccharide biosynthesis protein [Erysipelotrichaceae bacterium]
MEFAGKIVLITGGTGSFGRALTNRLLQTDVKEIRILSRDEKRQDDMRKEYHNPILKFYLGDVRDPASLKSAFKGVDYVFHAAALKQVPSCEFFPLEAIKTNILGSNNVIDASIDAKVRRVVFLSTDKAAYPINAMGMSKALMEKTVLSRARELRDDGPILCLTRFGNVLGSRGSVIPLFIKQIKEHKEVTITDPEMTRFIMSLDDAVTLVLHALERGGQGDFFIRKSNATKIGTIVEALQELLQQKTITKIIGPRHGEKQFETLVTSEEIVHSVDLGTFFKIVLDERDLNYDIFFNTGNKRLLLDTAFTSNNTKLLNKDELIELLKKEDFSTYL